MTAQQYYANSIEFLIISIQKSHLRLQDPEYKKSVKQPTYIKHISGLKELRTRAIAELRTMDRMKKEFFPIGAFVEFRFIPVQTNDWWSVGEYASKEAKVVGYSGDLVVIQVEGEQQETKVDPIYLTLKYIRT